MKINTGNQIYAQYTLGGKPAKGFRDTSWDGHGCNLLVASEDIVKIIYGDAERLTIIQLKEGADFLTEFPMPRENSGLGYSRENYKFDVD